MQETWVLSMAWKDSPGEGKGYLLQYTGLENSMDCIVHGVAKSQTRLSDLHFFTLHFQMVGEGIWLSRAEQGQSESESRSVVSNSLLNLQASG